jgi:hypothetical protein
MSPPRHAPRLYDKALTTHLAIHVVLHILIPGLVARFAYEQRWCKAWLIMIATMVVDLDHLLASPIYDPARCSIGFHPLHSYVAICVYFVMALIPKLRLVGIGLLIHMGVDLVDCLWVGWGCKGTFIFP